MSLRRLLMNLTVQGKFLLLLGAQLAILLGVFLLGWFSLDKGLAIQRELAQSTPRMNSLAQARHQLMLVRAEQLGVLGGANAPGFVEKRLPHLRELEADLEASFGVVLNQPWSKTDQEALAAGIESMRSYIRAFPGLMRVAKESQDANIKDVYMKANLRWVEEAKEAFNGVIERQVAANQALVALATSRTRASEGIMALGVLVAAGLGFSISFAVSRAMRRTLDQLGRALSALAEGDLTQRSRATSRDELGDMCRTLDQVLEHLSRDIALISQSAEGTASAAAQLAATTDQLNRTAEDLRDRASLEQKAMTASSAALEEMSGNIHRVQQSTRQAGELADQSQAAGEKGLSSIQETGLAMQAIEESSSRVNRVTTVITDMARQTNLLSLNAAIEAAKAGTMGKGFAVVAEEVRKLAERSGAAAKEITGLIQESGDRVAHGARSVQEAARSLEGIEQNVRDNAHHVKQIAAAMAEQARSGAEVVQSVVSVTATVERNAAAAQGLANTVQETARTTEELARLAQQMQMLTRRFRTA
ncbi:MAG: methyl-accepting chemotaxis protein [Geothrix sp.]|nr:methyl-accepting chemotaxis protein [Geothrix sp.]